MVKRIQGKVKAGTGTIAVVVGQFNETITERLEKSCLEELKKLGVKDKDIRVVHVPGSFEIPLTAMKLAKKKSVTAVIALGAILKGETFHYELVARESARGLMDVSLMTGKPIVFEILSADTQQALQERSQDNGYNKGAVAAQVALEMADLLPQL